MGQLPRRTVSKSAARRSDRHNSKHVLHAQHSSQEDLLRVPALEPIVDEKRRTPRLSSGKWPKVRHGKPNYFGTTNGFRAPFRAWWESLNNNTGSRPRKRRPSHPRQTTEIRPCPPTICQAQHHLLLGLAMLMPWLWVWTLCWRKFTPLAQILMHGQLTRVPLGFY